MMRTAIKKNEKKSLITRFLQDEKGSTSLEYVLIVAVLSLATLTFYNTTAEKMGEAFTDVASSLSSAE